MKQVPPQYYSELEQIQAIDFVIVELALYLHTHPDDLDAIQQYNESVKRSKALKRNFEKKYGALTSFGYSYSRHPWEYKEAPWPWQV
ncbi:spore coat protein CotJB [Bacillus thermotolerans]|uniref:Polypeptide composition of the spore coat protein CotJB n=1 Tax=Bacillus thermotolerans TaxID=1221996 RepID=A0A0F5HXG7_BACTR|nr:spore coat protein CotJB [Bacillus thermotolerans]KKB37943.1 Polypeptide composition of the spore coat protein CotJB [Bacillus thermotolerans]KKB37976.1 Polypeptide composition of the spore coat protein CotJB [Bacillus thermotolerans]KKB38427.1 Polypeptide composition of the spore coat protein CotJB [Bacillus thermotolerans]